MGDPPTIVFAGRTWRVKAYPDPVGPGPNLFSADSVRVDDSGRLHLRIDKGTNGWRCAEVIGRTRPEDESGPGEEFGYGSYSWRLGTDTTALDPRSAVLGLFLWSDHPDQTHRELDIEFSGWGDGDAIRGSFAVQRPGGPLLHWFPPGPAPSVHTLEWRLGEVRFASVFPSGSTTWTCSGADVPSPGGDVRPHLNLWLFRGTAPVQPQHVVVEDFRYRPLRSSGSADADR